ncbi:MAG: hypothetical protein LC624_09605, partial [Halobacteriales archaeon]|nr:hypothetical protein [Halobacteriales archaeon]
MDSEGWALKTIGLLTQDFAAYYELVKHLKEQDLPFASLAFGDPLPPSVGVLITTPAESGKVAFPQVVLYRGDAAQAVTLALEQLQGKRHYQSVVIGIDPG